MPKYTVRVREVHEMQINCIYTIEAGNEEEAREMARDGSFESREEGNTYDDEVIEYRILDEEDNIV